MADLMRPRRSAVTLPVPEAEALVGEWRQQYDESARTGVPAHITILFPFLPPDDLGTQDEERLAAVFADTPMCHFQLARVGRFRSVVYLAPEPGGYFQALTQRVWSLYPSTPPYGGAFPEVVPHLTVAQADDPEVLDRADAAVRSGLPVAAQATEAWLMVEGDDDRWRIRRRLPMGG